MNKFWQEKSLEQMNSDEWESLCDGCGKCCLHKLENEENGRVYYTSIACEYLNITNCLCKGYANRKSLVPTCVVLSKENISQFNWLPTTCAYRVLSEGGELPEWHPLVSLSDGSVHEVGVSVASYAIPECEVSAEDFEDYILGWDV